MMKKLNIGCGDHFVKGWVNIDLCSVHPDVIAYDLRKGIPFEDNSVDMVYSSHVMEHIDSEGADGFLGEQYRVLKKGGIVRVVLPDLETITQNYLTSLAASKNGDEIAAQKYEWDIVELLDQMVRGRSGGKMYGMYKNAEGAQYEYIQQRHGVDGQGAMDIARGKKEGYKNSSGFSYRLGLKIKGLRRKLAGLAVRLIAGQEAQQDFKAGQFWNSGEHHKWMYDSYSLGQLLESVGFSEVTVRGAEDSFLDGFGTEGLDTVGGRERKPESMYIEARK